MNFIDKVVAYLAPEAGMRRHAARSFLDGAGVRDYAGGRDARRSKNTTARATSANVEIGSSLTKVRDRAREFVRDTWIGQRILDVMVSHTVGTGIVTSPDTGSDRDDRIFRLAFEEWSAGCDAEGVLDYHALTALAVRSMIEGGDAIGRMIDVNREEAGNIGSFRLLGLEGDQIDISAGAITGARTARLGIELGEWGKRKGIWLFKNHPGERSLNAANESTMVPWGDLNHLYRPLRFGQVRGISWFAPILLTGRDIDELVQSAIVRSKTQAAFAGFIHRSAGTANPLGSKTDVSGDKVTRIEPGMIADIGEAEITFSAPGSQSEFGEVYIAGMQAMAAGVGCTYDQVTGDLRQANYSSLRAGKVEFRRLVEQVQYHILEPRWCVPIKNRFVDRAILSGTLPRRGHGWPARYIMPANEPIDPKKDMEADILAVQSGRLAPQEFISAWGRDHRLVIADFKAFATDLDKANITLLTDPRIKTKAKTDGKPA